MKCKLIYTPIVFILFGLTLFAKENNVDYSYKPLYTYKLNKVIEVQGRQGIATDGKYYYVSGSKILYKYSKDGKLLLKNDNPFAEFAKPANHIGDIDVYNGEIFVGAETFIDGRGKNIQIAVFDAESLKYKRSMNWEPKSGQVEVCGLTVDTDENNVWMADWVDGRYLYKYDLKTGKYLGKLHLQPVPQYQQGIFYWNGYIFITADDGDAEDNEHDNMYRVKLDSSATNGHVKLEKTFTEVKRVGEIEGLTVDSSTNELIVLFNRGKRVVLGMPKGFYPGYDREIHELYIYNMSKNNSINK